MDQEYLSRKIIQCENIISRKINYKLFNVEGANEYLLDVEPEGLFLLWDGGSRLKTNNAMPAGRQERRTADTKHLKVEDTE